MACELQSTILEGFSFAKSPFTYLTMLTHALAYGQEPGAETRSLLTDRVKAK
jgi:hypothetical protein